VAIGSYLNPVGTIKEYNIDTNPNTLLGFGTWSAFGTGRVTVAIDAGQAEFDTNGETGGAKTHTLTTAELAAHGHDLPSGIYNKTVVMGGSGTSANVTTGGGGYSTNGSGTVVVNTGSGTAHNNLQPYITVFRWVRIS